jgi:hypothetical protein
MTMMTERFDLILDPSELWTVWDKVTDEPAMFAGEMLAGLSRDEAEAALRTLLEVARRGDKPAEKTVKKDAA